MGDETPTHSGSSFQSTALHNERLESRKIESPSESEIEQSRAADISVEECHIVDDPCVFLTKSPEVNQIPTKKLKNADLLETYTTLFPGQTRLRKICDDQEIYEVECVGIDLENLQPLGPEGENDREVKAKPIIKLAEEFERTEDESSTAACNLVFHLEKEHSDGSHYESPYGTDMCFLKSAAQAFRENDAPMASPDSSCGTLSPEQDVISPKALSLPKFRNNLDFPWTPLFEGKKGTRSPVSVIPVRLPETCSGTGEPSASVKSAHVTKVKFLDDTSESVFAYPAVPNQAPFRATQASSSSHRTSPYRVTPHPSTGRTVMPAALPEEPGAEIQGNTNYFTPQQGVKKFVLTPSSAGSENSSLSVLRSDSERSPFDGAPPTVPNNTPVEDTASPAPQILSVQRLQELLKTSEVRLVDDSNSALNRHHHNEKERMRRHRIKSACERLRTLIPGLSEKTDKATVFEFAVHYIAYLRSLLDGDFTSTYDRDFLKKAERMMSEDGFADSETGL